MNLLCYLANLEHISGINDLIKRRQYHLKFNQTYDIINYNCKYDFVIHLTRFNTNEDKLIDYLKYKNHLYKRQKRLAAKILSKYKNINLKNLNKNYESWFDKLPYLVKHKILKKLDKQSLINFSKAYSKHLNTCLNPIYWNDIQIHLTNDILNLNEIKCLFKYLGRNLNKISINWNDFDFKMNYELFQEYFSIIPNLTHLNLNACYFNDKHTIQQLIEFISNNLKKLRYINLKEIFINDNNLKQLLNLRNLSSIELNKGSISEDVILEFFTNTQKLVFINFESLEISDRSLNFLFEQHYQHIEALKVNVSKCRFDIQFSNINKCKSLKELSLKNCLNLSNEFINKIKHVETLTSLELVVCKNIKQNDFNSLLQEAYFKNLTRLFLNQVQINDSTLSLIVLKYPFLEELHLSPCCKLTNKAIRGILLKLNNLKYLSLISLNENIDIEYFDYIGELFLFNLEYLILDVTCDQMVYCIEKWIEYLYQRKKSIECIFNINSFLFQRGIEEVNIGNYES